VRECEACERHIDEQATAHAISIEWAIQGRNESFS